ncbi:hypothetical protein [Arsenicicoccus sp. oral taxon 190]|uniref:hypothetical protein n=1 Tax=Arsenicicoccus sp. oral taxon 190 TaxID=1658671 RepID=UPI00067A0CC8|nr:hypothetical protein [Arsenicicoccus sp. oral taxon 190]AKT52245.1 hypothetical protein ADJ73_14950 [Arsenicicoccus sp. oral taxon 190]
MLAIGEHELGLDYVDRAFESTGVPQSDAGLARLHGIRAELLLARGDLDAALAESEQAARLVAHAGLDPAEHLRRAASVRAAMGDRDAPLELRRLADDETRALGEPSLATALALATA